MAVQGEALAGDPQQGLAPAGIEIVIVGGDEALHPSLLETVGERVPVGQGFVAFLLRDNVDPDWRSTIERIARERIGRHRDLGALAQAVREVPRSNPFESMDDLEFCEVPALVIASHDTADPRHPYAVAEAYAERLPQARLISEKEGESPLAWQGGKLSREIASFCATPPVEERIAQGGEP